MLMYMDTPLFASIYLSARVCTYERIVCYSQHHTTHLTHSLACIFRTYDIFGVRFHHLFRTDISTIMEGTYLYTYAVCIFHFSQSKLEIMYLILHNNKSPNRFLFKIYFKTTHLKLFIFINVFYHSILHKMLTRVTHKVFGIQLFYKNLI